jgi:hypothetical protein
MALLSRIYFNAVFGALGGLIGWMLFGVFVEKNATIDTPTLRQAAQDQTSNSVPVDERAAQAATDAMMRRLFLLGGALIGGSIGYFVVSVEALRDRSFLRFVRLASYGLVLGSLGGACGIFVGDEANYWLVRWLGSERQTGFKYVLHLAGILLARGVGWMFLGVAIGGCEGVAARSLGKFSYGTIGGALGGGVGGALFGLSYESIKNGAGSAPLLGALGLMLLGACIGSLSAFVQGVFQPASVKVLRGWQEGREYPLDKGANLIGRDEHADIALFRDMRVEKRHAVIQRLHNRYVFVNNDAPADATRVNDEPVARERELNDGDRIQLGNVVLRFQARAAANRTRPRR